MPLHSSIRKGCEEMAATVMAARVMMALLLVSTIGDAVATRAQLRSSAGEEMGVSEAVTRGKRSCDLCAPPTDIDR